MILISPAARDGVVVLTNSDAAGASELTSQLLEIVLGIPPREHREVSMNPTLYNGYIGRYNLGPVAMTIVREGNQLFAQIGGRKTQMFPESVLDYFFKLVDAQITFVTGGNGRATGLILHEGGTDLYANRIE